MSEYQKYPADKRKFDEAWERAFKQANYRSIDEHNEMLIRKRPADKQLDAVVDIVRKACSPEHIPDVTKKVCRIKWDSPAHAFLDCKKCEMHKTKYCRFYKGEYHE